MAKVAIVYHSGYGHTEHQAKAVSRGAATVEGTQVDLLSVADFDGDAADAHWAKLDAADAIIFGAPTYMGSVSGDMKKFMDATAGAWSAQKWANKLAAGFTNSGAHSGDKLSTLISFVLLAGQHGMIWVNLNLMPGNNASTGSLDDLNRVGGFIGAMSQSNVDQGVEGMQDSDLRTAEHLGRRVAETASRIRT
ncbi:MAG: flavodoxin family protein [Pseudomonadota bacterium]